jgi:DNA-binding NarL/FixJ family response regulator
LESIRLPLAKGHSGSLNVEVVAEADASREALPLVERLQPDVVVMDVDLPAHDDLDTAHTIKARYPNVRVVILTLHTALRNAAVGAGADAFVLKGTPPDEMVNIILRAVTEPRP